MSSRYLEQSWGQFKWLGYCQLAFLFSSEFSHACNSFPSPHFSFLGLCQQNPVLARPLGRFAVSFFSVPYSFRSFFLEIRSRFVFPISFIKLDFHFRRNLRDSEIVEFSSLLILLDNSHLSPSRLDSRIWSLSSFSIFSVSSFFFLLFQFLLPLSLFPLNDLVLSYPF